MPSKCKRAPLICTILAFRRIMRRKVCHAKSMPRLAIHPPTFHRPSATPTGGKVETDAAAAERSRTANRIAMGDKQTKCWHRQTQQNFKFIQINSFEERKGNRIRGVARRKGEGEGEGEGEAMSNGNRMNDSIRHQIFTADV